VLLKIRGYAPAIRRVLPQTEHRRHERLTIEPRTRTSRPASRERVLQFKSAEHAQRILGPFSANSNRFRPRRHRSTACAYRQIRTDAHTAWQDVTLACLPA
jgi:putative transposase